jgi:hypothetical protein
VFAKTGDSSSPPPRTLRYVVIGPNEPPTARPAATTASRPASNIVRPPRDCLRGGAATPIIGGGRGGYGCW